MKTRNGRRPIAGIFSMALLGLAASAGAATFTVNDLGDASDANPGDSFCATAGAVCTLRAAIEEANANATDDTIDFGFAGTIQLGLPLPPITTNLLVDGPGEGTLTIDANFTGRPFFVNGGVIVVTIQDLTIANGVAQGGAGGVGGNAGSGGGGGGMGGAIFLNAGTLTILNVTLDGNTALGGAGGAFGPPGVVHGGGGGGALGNGGDGTVGPGTPGSGGPVGEDGGPGSGSTLFPGPGGPGGFAGGGGGGGHASLGNAGGPGGPGGFGGGGAGAGGSDFESSALGGSGGLFGGTGAASNLNAGGAGGGGAGLGGALFSRAGTLTLTNVNFTGNSATGGASGGGSATAGEGKGGGLFVTNPGVTLIDGGGNTWIGNTATDHASVLGDDDHVFGTTLVPVEVSGIEID